MEKLTSQNSQYFQSLPAMIKESIMQSGVDFYSEEELRQFVDGLNNQ